MTKLPQSERPPHSGRAERDAREHGAETKRDAFGRLERFAESVKFLFTSQERLHARAVQDAERLQSPRKAEVAERLLAMDLRSQRNQRLATALVLGLGTALGNLAEHGEAATVDVPVAVAKLVQQRSSESTHKPTDWSWVHEDDAARKAAKMKAFFAKTMQHGAEAIASEEREAAMSSEYAMTDAEAETLTRDFVAAFDKQKWYFHFEEQALSPAISEYTLKMDMYLAASAFANSHSLDETEAYHDFCTHVMLRGEEMEERAGDDIALLRAAAKMKFAAGDADMKLSPLLASK